MTEIHVFVGSLGSLTDVPGTSYGKTRLDNAKVQITLTVDTQTGVVSGTGLALAGRICLTKNVWLLLTHQIPNR